ncbi:MAG: molybdopterin-synthase adenylyltransferase MoeB [Myxococcales bacterium]|nr:molybdopterin-synthase adenylyltransferase MoeB [Myxococcales bacterium]
MTDKTLPPLTDADRVRYHRHLLLGDVGEAGQRRLKAGRVLLIGAGGLGSPVALYLAAAGVGRLGLVDFDVVDRTNLQRQILYADADVGQPKAEVAAAKLRAQNPDIEVVAHRARIDASNAFALIDGYDVIVDGADNFTTRYLVNDLAVLSGRPLVHGAIFQFDGQASVFAHDGGPCYRCLYPEPPAPELAPNCAEAGVLGVLPGLIGLVQATEAVKLLLGVGETLSGRLLTVDALDMRFRTLRIARNRDCPVCGDAPTITGLSDTTVLCATAQCPWDVTPAELRALQADGRPLFLLDVRTPAESAAARIGGRLIPIDALPAHVGELDPKVRTVAICRSGQRSARATELLRAAGFADVWNLRGGLQAWIAAGHAVETD